MDEEFFWRDGEGDLLSPWPMTPTAAGEFLQDQFERRGYEIVSQFGKFGVRRALIGGQYRWFSPEPVADRMVAS